ncbi:MAG: class I SAM-dependent methyltransferase [Acidobacteria bacterium]|nr:class I SAM-dependent methyltransferase [Acidobacteriota bacterium]
MNLPIEPEARRRYNEELFTLVAPKYHRTTRLLSFGQDARWKRVLIQALPALDAPNCLDIACGTGDLTEALAERYPRGNILGIDLTQAMIAEARRRNTRSNVAYKIQDMCAMDIVPTHSIDIVTGGYALRNAQDLPKLLSELSRVMKKGASAAFLEFSKADSPLLGNVHRIGLNAWGSLCGLILHRDADVYRYIPRSLERFPGRRELVVLMEKFGLEPICCDAFFVGLIEISVWRKRARGKTDPTTPRERPASL